MMINTDHNKLDEFGDERHSDQPSITNQPTMYSNQTHNLVIMSKHNQHHSNVQFHCSTKHCGCSYTIRFVFLACEASTNNINRWIVQQTRTRTNCLWTGLCMCHSFIPSLHLVHIANSEVVAEERGRQRTNPELRCWQNTSELPFDL